jgi:CTP:molybdopterin cytidylyltransferase MocA
MKTVIVYPVILAAGPSIRRFFPPGSPGTQNRSPFEIAAANCAGHRALPMHAPIFVLGCDAERLARYVPASALVVINRHWRAGQLSSLLAGLRRVPRAAAFMLYPVDLVDLTPAVIGIILRGFSNRARGKEIIMPAYKGRGGHPAIFSANLRDELRRAKTARDVVYRDLARVAFMPVRSASIWKASESQSNLGNSQT